MAKAERQNRDNHASNPYLEKAASAEGNRSLRGYGYDLYECAEDLADARGFGISRNGKTVDEAKAQGFEFAEKISTMTGRRLPRDIAMRLPVITVSTANYGRMSSILIEWEGSPVRFPIYMGDISYAPDCRPLLIDGKAIRAGQKKTLAAIEIELFVMNMTKGVV